MDKYLSLWFPSQICVHYLKSSPVCSFSDVSGYWEVGCSFCWPFSGGTNWLALHKYAAAILFKVFISRSSKGNTRLISHGSRNTGIPHLKSIWYPSWKPPVWSVYSRSEYDQASPVLSQPVTFHVYFEGASSFRTLSMGRFLDKKKKKSKSFEKHSICGIGLLVYEGICVYLHLSLNCFLSCFGLCWEW